MLQPKVSTVSKDNYDKLKKLETKKLELMLVMGNRSVAYCYMKRMQQSGMEECKPWMRVHNKNKSRMDE